MRICSKNTDFSMSKNLICDKVSHTSGNIMNYLINIVRTLASVGKEKKKSRIIKMKAPPNTTYKN